jgi:RNA polymerase sigma-70 factor (ECF subfamily)
MTKLDAELVLGMHRGDVDAFDALYLKYHQPVYRNIIKLVKDTTIAEDILQEVFIKLWENKKSIKADQSVAGWLFVVSFNLSVNQTRKKLREHTLHKELFHDDVAAEKDFMLYEHHHQLLEKAIEQLSPQKKKIIRLCKLEGKTYEQVANELNISRHTVKEYLSSAMSNLNDYMRKHSKQSYVAILVALLTLK